MDKETQILVLRDNAKNELLQIVTIEQGLTYLNKVKALETWAEAEKKDAELVLIMAEQRVRSQGIIGRLIKEAQESGELLKNGQNKIGKTNPAINGCRTKSLEEVGIERSEASKFKRIATIPQDRLEEFIAEKKEAGEKPSTMAAVRLADELTPKPKKPLKVGDPKKEAMIAAREIGEQLEEEKLIADWVKQINALRFVVRSKIKAGIKA